MSRAENVSVAHGRLRVALRKEKAGDKEYTAGGVISTRSFKYGYYEARFRCPAGKGWHTSFWMTPHADKAVASSQEVDVCEQDSVDPKSYSLNLHEWKPAHKGHKAERVKTPDLSADFHVWGCEFTPKHLRYFFDGKLVATKDVTGFKHDEQSIWLTVVAAGLEHTDKVDDAKLPAYAEFDWVRFYEKQPEK